MAIDEISVADLRAHVETAGSADGGSITVIDVREPDEWASGHIAGARLVPLGTVADRLDEFDGSPTFVICRAGGRSARACEFASDHGLQVVNVAGGMLAWEQAGFEITHD